MSLLDGFLGNSIDDPKTMAVMNLAAGLLGGGNFGQALGRGLGGYQQSLKDARAQKLEDEMMGYKREELKSAAELRKLKNEFASRLQGLFSGAGEAPTINGKPVDMEALSVDPQMPGTPRYVTPESKGQTDFNEAIADPKFQLAAKISGFDLTDIAKLAQPNWQNVNGNLVNTNARGFKGGFQPGMHITPSGQAVLTVPGRDGLPIVGAAPGSLETVGAFQQQEQDIRNRGTLLPRDYVSAETGAPIGGSVGAYLAGQQRPATPAAQPPQRQPIGGNLSNLTPQAIEAIARDAQANGIQNPVANFVSPPNTKLNVTIPRLQSSAEAKAADEKAVLPAKAQGEINTNWIKSSYQPTLDAGGAASQVLTNVAIAKSSLANIGQTGWGTEAKATAASVLSALGVAPKNAEMFASNVQTFQNVAMTNLKTQLDAAAGPQTEGDADRASKLFAQLKNTPQANAFILDVMEAKAQRDAAKAKFYQGALPIAQREGDLAAVDREWSARAPSIFDMPSMKKWNVK